MSWNRLEEDRENGFLMRSIFVIPNKIFPRGTPHPHVLTRCQRGRLLIDNTHPCFYNCSAN
jgi:hypothetical protein